jgi:enoyl-CoA hydratase
MSYSTKITLETRGHVLMIGLNRPDKLNAADLEMLHSLAMAYGQLDSDPNLRVGLVYAHGDHFTAGLDLMDIGPKMASGQLNLVPEGGLDPWGIATKQISKPVVMAIRGTCYTLGVELALVSDIVVAADDAKFAQLEVTRGILPFGGGSFRFPKAAGWSNAMRYLLTGDSFGAQDAYRFNLVTEVVEVGQEFDRALELAIRIASQAPLAVQATLASARAGDTAQEKAQLMIRLGKLMQSNDVMRGMEAFMSKQPAKFEGN